jgi:hypothetical protein
MGATVMTPGQVDFSGKPFVENPGPFNVPVPLLVDGKPVSVDDSFMGLDGGELAHLIPGLERFYHRLSFVGLEPDAEDMRTLDLAARLAAENPLLPAFVGAASGLAERVRGARVARCFPKEADLAECKVRLDAVGDWKDAYFCHLRSGARWAAELAAVRAELAAVKGDKAAFRKWKREEKADRKAVRALDVARLLGKAGWTVEQAAEEMGVSASTVERLAREARAAGILKKRTAGRRGSGRLVTGEAGRIVVDNATSEHGD